MKTLPRLLALLMLIAIAGNCFACYPETDEIACRFAKRFGLANNTTKSIPIQNSLSDTVAELQTEIERIADKNVSYIEKIQDNGYISHTIKEYFASRNSTVQLKSLRGRETLERSIYTYLRLLSDYSEARPDEEIQIAFYKDMNEVLDVEKVSDRVFFVKVNTWALFTKKSVDGIVKYEDVTNKVFHAVLTLDPDGLPTIKIEHVTVIDTYSVNEFKRRFLKTSSN